MEVDDIRVFIPSKNYETSKAFYESIGFKAEYVTDELTLFENGECSFFLQRFYNEEFACNLMLQLSVFKIEEVWQVVISLKGFDIRYEPIKSEPWGKVIYLWGPSGELWHITEFFS